MINPKYSAHLIIGLLLIFSFNAYADWVNYSGAEKSPNIAEIYVMPKTIKLILEVDPKGKSSFGDFFGQKFNSPKAHGLEIFADKHLLKGKVRVNEMRKRIARQSPFPPPGNKKPSERVYYLQVDYPLQKKPKTLTLIAPRDKAGLIAANVGFIVYHDDVRVINFRYLTKRAELALNWKDPWYSAFKNKRLDRYYKHPVMSFLYIEPYEVRHEALMRVIDMQPLLSFQFSHKKYITPEARAKIKSEIAKLFLKKNPITIDGVTAKPILDQVNFVNFSEKGVQVVDKAKSVKLTTATVGIIISYITKGMPRKVTVHWNTFSNTITTVPIVMIDPMGPLRQNASSTYSTVSWQNYLNNYVLPRIETVMMANHARHFRIPLLSTFLFLIFVVLLLMIRRRYIKARPITPLLISAGVVLIGTIGFYRIGDITIGSQLIRPRLSSKEAQIVVTHLLKNIYRAFDYKNEEAVYDKLEISLSGHLLEKIYLQQRNTMELEKLGGAKAKVKTVKLLKLKRLADKNPSAYTFRGEWTVAGSVGHWGHVHQRTNKYDAILMLVPSGHAWKLGGLEPIAESRLK